jgi:hypothetical protein
VFIRISNGFCHFPRGKGEKVLKKWYLLEKYLHNFFVALVVSYWLTGRTLIFYWSISNWLCSQGAAIFYCMLFYIYYIPDRISPIKIISPMCFHLNRAENGENNAVRTSSEYSTFKVQIPVVVPIYT